MSLLHEMSQGAFYLSERAGQTRQFAEGIRKFEDLVICWSFTILQITCNISAISKFENFVEQCLQNFPFHYLTDQHFSSGDQLHLQIAVHYKVDFIHIWAQLFKAQKDNPELT